jgi:hypothetical protein
MFADERFIRPNAAVDPERSMLNAVEVALILEVERPLIRQPSPKAKRQIGECRAMGDDEIANYQ